MALTAADGVISNAEQTLRVTLADCTEFRTWTSTANQSDALARIPTDGLTPPAANADAHTLAELQAARPFALLSTDDRNGLTVVRRAESSYINGGSMILWFEQDVDPAIANDPSEISRRFKNTLGKIIKRVTADAPSFKGLLDLAYTAPYLAIDEVSLLQGPTRSEPDDHPGMGDFVYAVLQVIWGQNR